MADHGTMHPGSLRRTAIRLLPPIATDATRKILTTRAPVLEHRDDTLIMRRPHPYGDLTEYAGWTTNRRAVPVFCSCHADFLPLQDQEPTPQWQRPAPAQ